MKFIVFFSMLIGVTSCQSLYNPIKPQDQYYSKYYNSEPVPKYNYYTSDKVR